MLVTVGVACVAVLITTVVSLQLLTVLVTGQAQSALAAQTSALSHQPLASLRALMQDDKILGSHGERFLLIGPDGKAQGAVGAEVKRTMIGVLGSDRSASTTVQVGGDTYVVEGRPRPGGGGLVGFLRVADVTESSSLIAGRILIAVAIGLVAAIVAGVFLSRRLARPLQVMARDARRLAGGERGLVVVSHGIPEIDDVSTALTALDRALGTSEGRQREFLLSVSHEIRTPLTAIRGYAEALADGVIPETDGSAVGVILVAEAKRLDRFVSDLLELARLEADDFTLELRSTDATAVLYEVERAWRGQCAQLGVSLQVNSSAGDPVPILTDPMRLRQIVDGLVENALRATPSGGVVVLTAKRVGDDTVRIEVRDSGPGLTDADAAVAFERGILRARYRDLRPVNTGLGLSIAAQLVGRLGGTIFVRSSIRNGTCFAVDLTSAGAS
ncbi:HAMP domain-containing sensor histidine kinase [Cryobacterium sp. 10I1]|uniref:sensor histidine kinase n=1 Tax=Cryobacterium sp. 10I1 TaxID=3048578 RepID=UPI002B239C65|nr:HAMP domain-containing sensor histidine kinase [Cryobacterium sp. 10I1]MEB0304299.1 HAMP domain-containing sensor histidine kinase [Cryobacterium sp. 10I1]